MAENDEQQLDQDQMEALAVSIAERLEAGDSKRGLANRLAQGGFQYHEAVAFVDEVDRIRRVERRRSGIWNVLFGVILATAGIGISAWAYATAQPGESYPVMWGLAVVGLWRLGLGVDRLSKWRGKSKAQKDEDAGGRGGV